jgi:tetratricopeptide (TPR) repeat protein
MKDDTLDMHEEMFIAMMTPQEFVPLDPVKVADERRYYEMTPAISSKWSALWALMVLYDNAGLFDESIAVCREGLANPLLKEYHANAWFRIGQINEHKRDFDAALQAYLNSIETNSDGLEAQYWQHNNAAFCYLMKKEFDQAEVHCRIAIDLDEQDWKGKRRRWGDPLHWNAWKNLGSAMEYTGRHRDAASCYSTAIRLSPRNERAIAHLRRLLKRYPDVAAYWKETVEDLLTYYNVTI